jgi:hypothetical protein
MPGPKLLPPLRKRWKDHDTVTRFTPDDTGDNALLQHEKAIAMWVYDILERHYPKHLWSVSVDLRPEVMMAFIRHPLFPQNIAIRIHLAEIDSAGTIIMRQAGEALERYQVPRAALDVDAYLTAREKHRFAKVAPA